MLARVLLLWLVLLNLATALWWWAQPASAGGPVAPVASAAATTPGLTLLRELPAPVALPPCPAAETDPEQAAEAAQAASAQAQPGVDAQRDCTPLR